MADNEQTPVDLPAAVSSGWLAPASFPRTTRGKLRTEWDGEPFPVTVTKTGNTQLDEQFALAWASVGQLKALADQITEGLPMTPHDYNGHVAKEPDPEVRRIASAVVKLEALGYRWDAERCRWIAPGEDE